MSYGWDDYPDPRSKKFIRPFMSGGDFLNNIKRYCLWINDEDVEEALSIRLIQMRINLCKLYRLEGGRDAKKAASVPHRFFYRKYKDEDLIIVPRTSSGRRDYLPCGFMQKGTIVSNQAFVIYGASLETFAFISSRLHSLWMSVTSGRMRQDYSYSVNLTYNTFPFSTLNDSSKNEIVELAIAILSIREEYSMRTLAQLYDPIKMPLNLLDAHQSLDNCIEKLMFGAVFDTDEERLTALFNKYSEIIESQNA